MTSRRPGILDGTNVGLLAAIVALPLLALVVAAGPIRGFARRAIEARERQSEEISRLEERKRALAPVEEGERQRIAAALVELESDAAWLGPDPSAQLGHDLEALLAAAGASDVRVRVVPREGDGGVRPPLLVSALDGSSGLELTPNSVHVAMRADFEALRDAFDALAATGRAIQIDSARLVRDGDAIRSELTLTCWSREIAR
ncbi:MAG: hypothetical protein FJ108_17220 [Deltaproteobacteria bacterium]|nr:hypothetical protein [Deltaproteobacteria bacterium]